MTGRWLLAVLAKSFKKLAGNVAHPRFLQFLSREGTYGGNIPSMFEIEYLIYYMKWIIFWKWTWCSQLCKNQQPYQLKKNPKTSGLAGDRTERNAQQASSEYLIVEKTWNDMKWIIYFEPRIKICERDLRSRINNRSGQAWIFQHKHKVSSFLFLFFKKKKLN